MGGFGEFIGGLADGVDDLVAIGTDGDGDGGAETLEEFATGAGGLVRGEDDAVAPWATGPLICGEVVASVEGGGDGGGEGEQQGEGGEEG